MGCFIMKIHNNSINKVLNMYNNQVNTNKANKSQEGKKADQLNISPEARDFQLAMKQVKNQPEIRTEKVEEIKKQIQAGTYKVDAKAISEKMMRDANIYKKM